MQTYLLDKNVVRRAIEGIGKAQFGLSLTDEELASLKLLLTAEQGKSALFISIEMQHILERYGSHPDVTVFRRFVEVLQPARYYKRWTRRLKEHNFTREDAKVLALATFGAISPLPKLGVDYLITFDQPLINNFNHSHHLLSHRLKAMTEQLPLPYNTAKLPVVYSPRDLSLSDPKA